jgi:hypothetical protein
MTPDGKTESIEERIARLTRERDEARERLDEERASWERTLPEFRGYKSLHITIGNRQVELLMDWECPYGILHGGMVRR